MNQFKIALIYPFFGCKNSLFDLWLKTCQYNEEITFLIFTDQIIDLPSSVTNIKVRYMSFEYFRKLLQDKFSFDIQLVTPYKICDFRPAFGDVFFEELCDYTHWGYGDTDVILGDMSRFLTNQVLEEYDKLFWCGHLCIYKNNEKMRCLYKSRIGDEYPYINIFSDPKNCIFDEWWGRIGIDEIASKNNCSVYKKICFADIKRMYKHSAFDFDFEIALCDDSTPKHIDYFGWEGGKLYGYYYLNGSIHKTEFLYAHFQKRFFDVKVLSDVPKFYIVPNVVLETQLEAEQYYGSDVYIEAKKEEMVKYENWKRLAQT